MAMRWQRLKPSYDPCRCDQKNVKPLNLHFHASRLAETAVTAYSAAEDGSIEAVRVSLSGASTLRLWEGSAERLAGARFGSKKKSRVSVKPRARLMPCKPPYTAVFYEFNW